MKKILTLCAALLALTLCLAGCGGQTAEQPDPAPTGQEETATDPELALYGSDGATIALLGDVDGLAALDVQLETDPDAEPIHQEGDAWMTYTCPGLTATGYRTAATGAVGLARIDTTREDLATHRGIAVGATREEVQALRRQPARRAVLGRAGRLPLVRHGGRLRRRDPVPVPGGPGERAGAELDRGLRAVRPAG